MSKYLNPHKLFVGAFVPNWLMERPEVSAGAKLCYGRLCQFADKESGVAFPGQEALAASLGVGDRQARRYLAELESNDLIETEQAGLSQANRYRFKVHRWMSGQDRTHMSGQERTDMSGPKGRESKEKNKSNEDRTSLPFESEEFREAWALWEKHRREIKKSLTPSTVDKQFSKVRQWGEARSIQAIGYSIEMGYTGLFEPDAPALRVKNGGGAKKETYGEIAARRAQC